MKAKFSTLFVCLIYFANINAQELNGVRFGFGAVYSILGQNIYDYPLTPDTIHALQQQALSKGSLLAQASACAIQ